MNTPADSVAVMIDRFQRQADDYLARCKPADFACGKAAGILAVLHDLRALTAPTAAPPVGEAVQETPMVDRSFGGKEAAFRMDAYYYGFQMTGVLAVDLILSAVACAGKAYHHTEDWNNDCDPYHQRLRGTTPVLWIENAAHDAAALIRSLAAPAAEGGYNTNDCQDEQLRWSSTVRVAGRSAIPGALSGETIDDDALVHGDADDMQEALSAIAAELGCRCTLDDMLHALAALLPPAHGDATGSHSGEEE